MSENCPERTQIQSTEPTPAQIQALAQRDEQLLDRIHELERLHNGPDILPAVFGFASDAGDKGAAQTALQARLDDLGAQGIFLAGDNNLHSGVADTLDENWEVFADNIECGKVYAALGDIDNNVDDGAPQNTFLGSPSYYDVVFDRGSVHLFVLNSGFDEARQRTEDDGTEKNSVQYQWFADKIACSTSRYKIVMFHHPFVTSLDSSNPKQHVNQLDWDFHDLGVDLIINGHIKANEHLVKKGVHIINVSYTGVTGGRALNPDGDIIGETDNTFLQWHDRSRKGLYSSASYGVIRANERNLQVEVRSIKTDNIVHSFYV